MGEEEEDEIPSLQPLQELCIVLAFICSFSKECQNHLLSRFKREKEDVGDIAILLSEYIQSLGEEGAEEDKGEGKDGKFGKDGPVEKNEKEEVQVSEIKQVLQEWAKTLLLISTIK